MSFRRKRKKKSICYIYTRGISHLPLFFFFFPYPGLLWRHYVGRVRRLGAPFVRYVCRRHCRQKKRERTRQAENASPAATRNENSSPHHRQLGNMQQHTLNDIHLSDITTATTTLVCLSDGKIKIWNPPPPSRYILAVYVVPSLFRFEMTTRSCRANTWPTSAISAMIMVNQFHEQTTHNNTGSKSLKPTHTSQREKKRQQHIGTFVYQ